MKKFVSMLCAFLGLFMIGFTVQPSSTAQASEKTYVIDTDVTFPRLSMPTKTINTSGLTWI